MFRYTLLLCLSALFSGQLMAQTPSLADYIQKNYPKAKEAEAGIHYVVHKKGKGKKPQAGQYLLVEFEGQLLDGTTFDKSEKEPFVFQLGRRQVIQGWDRGLQQFKVGTELTLLLAPEMAYNKTGAGKLVPPNTPVKFDITILKVLDSKQYDEYMVELENKERERYKQMVEERFQADKKAIHKYCTDNKLKVRRSQLGVSYQVSTKGTGNYPKKGDIVSIQYEGYLVDGTLFEKNSRKEPFAFEVGARKAIRGLDDAITFFNKGAEGYIVIPSKLAYGPMEIDEEGIKIPPHSVLVFKIKVMDITKATNK